MNRPMNAPGPQQAITNLETGAHLILRAVAALRAWDSEYDGERERRMASELYYKALSLRLSYLLVRDLTSIRHGAPL